MFLTGSQLVEVQVTSIRGETCVFDKGFGFLDSGKSVVLQNIFLDDDAVDVVGAGVQAQFSQRKAHSQQRNLNMRDIVQIKTAEGQ